MAPLAKKCSHHANKCSDIYLNSAEERWLVRIPDLVRGRKVVNTILELGTGYWQGFMKRDKHLVTSRKFFKFDSKHADWCTYQIFEALYIEN